MPADFNIIIIVLNFFSLLSTLFILIVLIEHDRLRNHHEEKEEAQILNETREKSSAILNKASKQANKILTNAELKGIHIFAKEKIDSAKLAKNYEHELNTLEVSLNDKFNKSITEAQNTYLTFMKNLEATMANHVSESEKILTDKADTFLTQSQTALNDLISDVHEKVTIQVEKELTAVRAAVEEYKQRRIKIIDENIIEILEKTLRIALGKKMSLSDQSEFIYKALEEAKKEHALS